jgi:Protein of unknown function (DUF3987)/Domain of unknown function (DUF3854)
VSCNLTAASLRPEHGEHLSRFGIPKDILAAAEVQSVTNNEARVVLGLHGYVDADLSGILFNYLLPTTRDRVGARVRLDHPLPDGGKYMSEKGCRHYFFPPVASEVLTNVAVPVVIVEAEKSALALFALAMRSGRPMLPVAVGGCWGWKRRTGTKLMPDGSREPETGPSPDLDLLTWSARTAIIAYDANAATNADVQAARRQIARELRARGARVLIATIPAVDGVNGPDDLIAISGDNATLEALDAATPDTDVAPFEWPEPERIHSELPPVEPMAQELLPAALRPLALDVAERMQVPLDYPSALMVLCLAGAVNRRAVIQPKAQDRSWVVVPNLWGGIVAPPGYLKSPVIQSVVRPLNQIQTEWNREHEEAQGDFERSKEEHELLVSAWREQFKANAKKGKGAPERPADLPTPPTPRRLIVNDSTFEALHATMAVNPAGVLVIRDELTGWWSTLDRPGREGERAFCLQAWNGDTGHTIDRIGRGTVHVEACCMSMLGGIQPGRLRSYLIDALRDGPSNDGLIQRFQVLVWADTRTEYEYIDRPADAAAEDQAARIFGTLVALDSATPACFRFALDAQELFEQWLGELEARVRSDEYHPALISHLSKYRSLMPSLALLFELAERAGSDGFDGSILANSENFVSLEHAQMAAAWCAYLETHARRVYSCVTTPQLRAARELAGKIKKGKLGATFSCRDVYTKGWAGLDSPEIVKQAAEVLEDANWIRRIQNPTSHTGGRPSDRYAINPKVHA